MIPVDPECDAVAQLFSKKSVRAKYPVYVRSENPIFKRRGTSFNLKNVREYQPFDDLRQIDWKLYGRTDRYYIKEFFEEENDRLFFLIDTSASLNIFDTGCYKTFIASTAYILLKLHFTLSFVSFHSRINKTSLNIKEHKNVSRALNFLEDIRFEEKTDLVSVLKSVRNRYKPSTIFIFSDLFDRSYTPDTSVHFRRTYIFHFHTSMSEFSLNYGETEIEDKERGKKLLIPYNMLTRKKIEEREKAFLRLFDQSRGNYHYFRIQKNDDRVPFYWQILESLYD